MNITHNIKSDRNKFYNNYYLQEIVKFSLLFLEDSFFSDVIIYLFHIPKKSNKFKRAINLFKNKYYENQVKIKVIDLIDKLYDDFENIHNLRGAYLELLVYTIINKYYSPKICVLNTYITINERISKRTVDLFSIINNHYIVCECKIKYTNINLDDMVNFNILYQNSHHLIKPYFITLSDSYHMTRKIQKLYETVSPDFQFDDIGIISINNFLDKLYYNLF